MFQDMLVKLIKILGHSLFGVIVMNGLLLILKSTKWIWLLTDDLLSQSPLFYIIGTIVIALITLNVIDVMTALAEVRSEIGREGKRKDH